MSLFEIHLLVDKWGQSCVSLKKAKIRTFLMRSRTTRTKPQPFHFVVGIWPEAANRKQNLSNLMHIVFQKALKAGDSMDTIMGCLWSGVIYISQRPPCVSDCLNDSCPCRRSQNPYFYKERWVQHSCQTGWTLNRFEILQVEVKIT